MPELFPQVMENVGAATDRQVAASPVTLRELRRSLIEQNAESPRVQDVLGRTGSRTDPSAVAGRFVDLYRVYGDDAIRDTAIREIARSAREYQGPLGVRTDPAAVQGRIMDFLAQTQSPNSLADQEAVLEASEDIRAIVQQYREGRITEQAAADAVSRAYKTHGNVLLRTPEFAELAGIEQEVADMKTASMQAFSERQDIPMKYVRWNDRTNRPEVDQRAIETATALAQLRDRDGKPERERLQAIVQATKPSAPKRSDFENRFGKVDEDAFQQAVQRHQRDTLEFFRHTSSIAEFEKYLQGQSESVAPRETTRSFRSVFESGAPELTSSVPVDPAVAQREVNAGRRPPGIYVDRRGRKYRVTKE